MLGAGSGTTIGCSPSDVSVLGERAGVARLALTYGPRPSALSRPSFIERMVASAARGELVSLFEDEFRTPIYVERAARALAALVEAYASAMVRLGGPARPPSRQPSDSPPGASSHGFRR